MDWRSDEKMKSKQTIKNKCENCKFFDNNNSVFNQCKKEDMWKFIYVDYHGEWHISGDIMFNSDFGCIFWEER